MSDPRENLKLGPGARKRPGIKRYQVLLPEPLVRRVDDMAGPQGRSRWVTRAIREKLERDE